MGIADTFRNQVAQEKQNRTHYESAKKSQKEFTGIIDEISSKETPEQQRDTAMKYQNKLTGLAGNDAYNQILKLINEGGKTAEPQKAPFVPQPVTPQTQGGWLQGIANTVQNLWKAGTTPTTGNLYDAYKQSQKVFEGLQNPQTYVQTEQYRQKLNTPDYGMEELEKIPTTQETLSRKFKVLTEAATTPTQSKTLWGAYHEAFSSPEAKAAWESIGVAPVAKSSALPEAARAFIEKADALQDTERQKALKIYENEYKRQMDSAKKFGGQGAASIVRAGHQFITGLTGQELPDISAGGKIADTLSTIVGQGAGLIVGLMLTKGAGGAKLGSQIAKVSKTAGEVGGAAAKTVGKAIPALNKQAFQAAADHMVKSAVKNGVELEMLSGIHSVLSKDTQEEAMARAKEYGLLALFSAPLELTGMLVKGLWRASMKNPEAWNAFKYTKGVPALLERTKLKVPAEVKLTEKMKQSKLNITQAEKTAHIEKISAKLSKSPGTVFESVRSTKVKGNTIKITTTEGKAYTITKSELKTRLEDKGMSPRQIKESIDLLEGACFTGETLVAIPGGHKRIDELRVNDVVWSIDTETEQMSHQKVTEVFTRTRKDIVLLKFDGGQIYVTEHHLLMEQGKWWKSAIDFKPGDIIQTFHGTKKVTLVQKQPGRQKVYNLAVENCHTYFANGVLAHNDCTAQQIQKFNKSVQAAKKQGATELEATLQGKLAVQSGKLKLKGKQGEVIETTVEPIEGKPGEFWYMEGGQKKWGKTDYWETVEKRSKAKGTEEKLPKKKLTLAQKQASLVKKLKQQLADLKSGKTTTVIRSKIPENAQIKKLRQELAKEKAKLSPPKLKQPTKKLTLAQKQARKEKILAKQLKDLKEGKVTARKPIPDTQVSAQMRREIKLIRDAKKAAKAQLNQRTVAPKKLKGGNELLPDTVEIASKDVKRTQYENWVSKFESIAKLERKVPKGKIRILTENIYSVDKQTSNLITERLRTPKGNVVGDSLKTITDKIPKTKQQLDEFWNYFYRDIQGKPHAVKNEALEATSKELKSWIEKMAKAWEQDPKKLWDDLFPSEKMYALGARPSNPFLTISEFVGKTVKTYEMNRLYVELVRHTKTGKLSEAFKIIPKGVSPGNAPVLSAKMPDGKIVTMLIKDKSLLPAFESLTTYATPQVLNKFTRMMQSLITAKNPLFGFKNFCRDIKTGYVYGGENNPLRYIWDLGETGIELARATKTAEFLKVGKTPSKTLQQFQMKVGGGYIESTKGGTKGIAESLARPKFKELTLGHKLVRPVTATFRAVGERTQAFNDLLEQTARATEFKRTLNKTGDLDKAAYAANEVTVNFAKRGELTGQAASLFPYFNAGVQGLDKFVKQMGLGIKINPQKMLKLQVKINPPKMLKFLAKAGIPCVTFDVLNYFRWKDDPDWQKLKDNEKFNEYIIWKNKDGTFISLPKAREIDAVVSGWIYATTTDNFILSYLKNIYDNAAPADITENIFAPILGGIANYNFYRWKPIVPPYINENTPEYKQFTDYTSIFNTWVAGKLHQAGINVSPQKMDYVMQSYFGILAQMTLMLKNEGDTWNDIQSTLFSGFKAYPQAQSTIEKKEKTEAKKRGETSGSGKEPKPKKLQYPKSAFQKSTEKQDTTGKTESKPQKLKYPKSAF